MSSQQMVNNEDSRSFLWALISFIFPIIGLILYAIWYKELPQRARSCLKGIMTACIMYICFALLAACSGLGAFFFAFSH
ncbi:PLDc N-terminal domain-containing protein [Enterobacter hormaechei]|uniref:PLDc N-terminal domain-containing protein n=1 Tax=Enterobacter hormaechei TaxID=158836 RepID=UPI003AAA2927